MKEICVGMPQISFNGIPWPRPPPQMFVIELLLLLPPIFDILSWRKALENARAKRVNQTVIQ
jgi:hypothetical protein